MRLVADRANPELGFLNITDPSHFSPEERARPDFEKIRNILVSYASRLPSYKVSMCPVNSDLIWLVYPSREPDDPLEYAIPCNRKSTSLVEYLEEGSQLVWMHPYHAIVAGSAFKVALCSRCGEWRASDLGSMNLRHRLTGTSPDPTGRYCRSCKRELTAENDLVYPFRPLWHVLCKQLINAGGTRAEFAHCDELVAIMLSFLPSMPVLIEMPDVEAGLFCSPSDARRRWRRWTRDDSEKDLRVLCSDGTRALSAHDPSMYHMVMFWPPRRTLQFVPHTKRLPPTKRFYAATHLWPPEVHVPEFSGDRPHRMVLPCTSCGYIDVHTARDHKAWCRHGMFSSKQCDSRVMAPGRGFCRVHDPEVQAIAERSARQFEKAASEASCKHKRRRVVID